MSGSQLDSDLVEIFVERVLAIEDLAFRHGDDADFEAELQVERGSRGAWRPIVAPARLPPPALDAAWPALDAACARLSLSRHGEPGPARS